VRFAAPDAFRSQPADPGLEVILVNAKHAKAPLKADALAQANLDGGGNADAGPLQVAAARPAQDRKRRQHQGLQRRIAELEEAAAERADPRALVLSAPRR
jgi:protein TonB